jgi:hypothetical protein
MTLSNPSLIHIGLSLTILSCVALFSQSTPISAPECPEDDPLCDTEGDEYYNEEYNSPLLQPDPNMSKTELTLDNLDIPPLGSDGRVKWNRKSAVNLRKLAQQILASRRKLIKNFTKERMMLPRLF